MLCSKFRMTWPMKWFEMCKIHHKLFITCKCNQSQSTLNNEAFYFKKKEKKKRREEKRTGTSGKTWKYEKIPEPIDKYFYSSLIIMIMLKMANRCDVQKCERVRRRALNETSKKRKNNSLYQSNCELNGMWDEVSAHVFVPNENEYIDIWIYYIQ